MIKLHQRTPTAPELGEF